MFSNHANSKIAQRKLSRVRILETIKNPDLIGFGYDGREKLLKKFAKNYLQVIVMRTSMRITVVTAHWIAKPASM